MVVAENIKKIWKCAKNETQERDSNYIANNEKKWNNNHKNNYYVAFRAVKIYWIILKANCN